VPGAVAGVRFVTLRDVTLRDGLQDEEAVDTATKVRIFDALVAAGVRDLELTSFVRPDRVPALADAEALCAATAGREVTRWGLVLNRRGAQRALAAGLGHLQFVVSVSDTHSRHNTGRSTGDAMAALAEVCADAAAEGAVVEVTLATAFGCPYEQAVDPARVAELARRCESFGVTSIGLADTIGVAVPVEVTGLIDVVRDVVTVPVGVHLHDTRGLGVANALAAVEAGIDRIDGSVGALGGCPFAPGASGNLALEDLVHVLDATGIRTGVSVTGLIDAARIACDAVGRKVESHVGVAGPRFAEHRVPPR